MTIDDIKNMLEEGFKLNHCEVINESPNHSNLRIRTEAQPWMLLFWVGQKDHTASQQANQPAMKPPEQKLLQQESMRTSRQSEMPDGSQLRFW